MVEVPIFWSEMADEVQKDIVDEIAAATGIPRLQVRRLLEQEEKEGSTRFTLSFKIGEHPK